MALSKIDVANMLTGATPVANGGTAATTLVAAGLGKRPNAKPIIFNGDMQISQRATSSTGVGNGDSGYPTIDRWSFQEGGDNSAEFTMTQATDVPTGYGFTKSLKLDCTTADGSPGASDIFRIEQRFEGQDLQGLKKGTSNAEKLTLSFWVKSTKTGTFIAELIDSNNSRHVSTAYTVSSSDTWENKVVNFPADTTGAFTNDNGESLRVIFNLLAGSNFTEGTLATTWAAYNDANEAVGQVNIGDNTSNNWLITGVQLEVGEFSSTTLPPFQHESYGENLLRCQRYFQHIVSGNHKLISYAHWASGSQITFILNILEMRAVPTIDYDNGNDYWAIGGSSGSTNTIDNLTIDGYSTNKCVGLYSGTAAGGTTGYAYYGFSDNASARLALVSEL